MRKNLNKIFLTIMILILAGVVLMPHQAEAACVNLMSISPSECVLSFASAISTKVLEVVSWFLAICGVLLNVAIILTLNIKVLYESSPAINEVWIVIRNISSIFIIFALMYTSIMKILGYDEIGGIKKLVKNIIIAGLLINFSLFFTKVLIDTSNLVSLQFYRAIVPNSQNVDISKLDIGSIISGSFSGGGGISDIFMAGLKIPKIYNDKQGILQTGNTSMMIIIHTVLGSILMIIAGITLVAAALAFTVRIALLLFFMGFSPLYFIGMIFPKVSSNIKEYVDKFIDQLIFMPVYLILLYVAMKFIGEGSFFTSLGNAQSASGDTTITKLLLADVGLIFQYVFALIIINVPLMAAIKVGGIAPKWAKDVKGLAGKWVGGAGSFAGQHTIGRIAKVTGDKLATSKFATNNPNFALFANKNLAKVSGAAFAGTKGGYDKRFSNYSKERADFVMKRAKLSADVIEQDNKGIIKDRNDSAIAAWDKTNPGKEKSRERDEFIKQTAIDIRKNIEKEARIDASNAMADALARDWNPITRAASKKAADAIRDDLGKTKPQKDAEELQATLLKTIQELEGKK